MEQQVLEDALSRIQQMEALFDSLQQAEDPKSPLFQSQLHQLLAYYEGGLWLQDYRLDEQGCLPPELKRGVLSQDGIFHFLESLD